MRGGFQIVIVYEGDFIVTGGWSPVFLTVNELISSTCVERLSYGGC